MIADTPRTWPNGPSLSTLHVLLIFAGIPLLVIVAVSLMVLAPGWVKGPRYRPGMPWQARTEWFGPGLSADSGPGAGTPSAALSQESQQAGSPPPSLGGPGHGSEPSGGASAGW